MEFDFEALPKDVRYKLLCAFVAPRPIALVTTLSPDGIGNAAPFSFFNVFGDDPPIIIRGIQARPDGTPKDTTINIKATGEFVAHLVDQAMARQMLECAIEFPPGADELALTGLRVTASQKVRPGRIREAPAALECRLETTIEYDRRSIVLGRVVNMWVRDDCIDPKTLYVNSDAYRPLARLHKDYYIVAEDLFELPRPTMEEFLERKRGRGNRPDLDIRERMGKPT
jgi:flavin reductase (DIM6/NTAB) family NADH-FMN oxidoreductase RutF